MRIPIVDLDAIGIVFDMQPHDLPPNAWSDGKNVRFSNGRTEKIRGHEVNFTPAIDPLFLMPARSIDKYYWLYADAAKVFKYDGLVSSEITKLATTYNALDNAWGGTVLNGLVILNNGADVPQAWDPFVLNALLDDLANWPTTWRTRSLKSFKYHLVSLATAKGSDVNPYRVNWSHPADPGTLPASWDITDPTKDAGEVTLAETDGFLVDQLQLGNVNVIYKEDTTHIMQHVGGIDIFGFRPLLQACGLLAPKGLLMFNPGTRDQHVVFGQTDIYVHDGATVSNILRGRMRDWLYNNLDASAYKTSFIAHNAGEQEIWICFPTTGATTPNVALIWNYRDNTTTVRDLPPNTVSMSSGQLLASEASPTVADTWGTVQGSWDEQNRPWGFSAFAPAGNRLLFGTTGAGRKVYAADLSPTFDGAPIDAYVERIGLATIGQDRFGKPAYDGTTRKLVTEVYPRVTGDLGTVVNIYVGTQDTEDKPIEWHGPFPFRIGIDTKVEPQVSGMILSIRFAVVSNSTWTLSGYDLEIAGCGGF